MGWATEEALKIAEDERKREADRCWQLHVNEIVKRDASEAFNRLSIQVREYAEEFNLARGYSPLSIETSENLISVTKAEYPAVCVKLTFIQNGVRYWSREVASMRDPIDSERLMSFSVKRDGQLYLDGTNHDEIARRVLGKIFGAFKPRD